MLNFILRKLPLNILRGQKNLTHAINALQSNAPDDHPPLTNYKIITTQKHSVDTDSIKITIIVSGQIHTTNIRPAPDSYYTLSEIHDEVLNNLLKIQTENPASHVMATVIDPAHNMTYEVTELGNVTPAHNIDFA